MSFSHLLWLCARAGGYPDLTVCRTPIELIKCRMQVQMLTREGAFGAAAESSLAGSSAGGTSKTNANASTSTSSTRPFSTSSLTRQLHTPTPIPQSAPSGPFTLVVDTIRKSGIRGLWLGQTGTLFRETGGSAAWFGAYETSTRLWLKHYHGPTATKADLTTIQLMSSGALAGVSYNVILFPADSVKSSMQTWAELNPGSPTASFGATAKNIYRTRGIRGLYAGCGLTCLRSGPSSAMIFLIYQRLEQNFGYIFGIN